MSFFIYNNNNNNDDYFRRLWSRIGYLCKVRWGSEDAILTALVGPLAFVYHRGECSGGHVLELPDSPHTSGSPRLDPIVLYLDATSASAALVTDAVWAVFGVLARTTLGMLASIPWTIACKAKLQSHALMLEQMACFDCRAAQCTIAADRVLVQRQADPETVWIQRDSVTCTQTDQEALDAFNTYIRGYACPPPAPPLLTGAGDHEEKSTGAAGGSTPHPHRSEADSAKAMEPSVTRVATAGSQASEGMISEERYNRRVEEEAISKLERLGYPREEIVRQLKDPQSHLCKLYHRFLKALTAWDSRK
eukprot:s703_g14.t1